MNLIEYSLKNYSTLFVKPVDVLEHLFCANGNKLDSDSFNGVNNEFDSISRNGSNGAYEIFADQFKDLPVCPVARLYQWSENELFQPFRKYGCITIPAHQEGIREAARYFIKCLEMSTEEKIKERWLEQPRLAYLLEIGYFETSGYSQALSDWKMYGIPALKEFFEL